MFHLTQRCYLLILIVSILGVIGQWSMGDVQSLWRIPAALLCIILTTEWLICKKTNLILERVVSDKLPLGREFSGLLKISNQQSSHLRVKAVQSLSENLLGKTPILNWNLQPGASSTQQFNATPQSLGTLQWGPVYLRVLGLFGFAWWERKISLPGELKIIPDHLSYKEQSQGTTQTGERPFYSHGSGMELLALRDYVQGDPLRSIDWKATARTGKRTVRLLMQEQYLELMLMIDVGQHSSLHSANLSRLHHFVNVAARLSERALLNGDSVGMISYADKPLITMRPARKKTALQRVRQQLTDLNTHASAANPLLAMSATISCLSHRSMIVIFTDLEREDIDGQLAKAVELATPKHLIVVAGILDEDVLKLKNQTAKQWLDPYHSLAATEILHSTQQNISCLKRIGTQIVYTRANLLDKTVLNRYETLRASKKV